MNNSYTKGKKAFESGLFCAESVLSVIAEEEGVQSDLVPGIATGLCSGMARTCSMCGALTGGILALGLVFGRKSPADSVEFTYEAVQELKSKFKQEFGSENCQELLECDLGTEEGQIIFNKNKLHIRCAEYTGKSTELVRSIINANK
jgi:C_GCAxxG_C_C family probable redox protein